MTSIPLGPTADVLPHKLLHTLQPWKCTDETMEIVIARSHLEVRGVEGVPTPANITWGGVCVVCHILVWVLGVGGMGLSPAGG